MGTMEEIRSRLLNGATPQSLVAEGFARSSVYTVNRDLKQKDISKRQPKDNPEKMAPTPSPTVPSPSLPRSVSDDPEIIDLQKQVAKAKLQEELAAVQGRKLSKEVLEVYRYANQQGYADSIGEFVDQMVASYLINFPEDFDPRFTPWAQWVFGEEDPVNQPDNRDGRRRYLDARWEHIAMELAAKRIGA